MSRYPVTMLWARIAWSPLWIVLLVVCSTCVLFESYAQRSIKIVLSRAELRPVLDIFFNVTLLSGLDSPEFGVRQLAEDVQLAEKLVRNEIGSRGSALSSGMALARCSVVGPGGRWDILNWKPSFPLMNWLVPCTRASAAVGIFPSRSDAQQHNFRNAPRWFCWCPQLGRWSGVEYAIIIRCGTTRRMETAAKGFWHELRSDFGHPSDLNTVHYAPVLHNHSCISHWGHCNDGVSQVTLVYRSVKTTTFWSFDFVLGNGPSMYIASNLRWRRL